MIKHAKKIDPKGSYYLIRDNDYSKLPLSSFNLILSAFTFDNILVKDKLPLLSKLVDILDTNGVIINLVSSPEIYTNEWASFSTKDFPQNNHAKSGDIVPIITTDFNDKRPCYDIFCTTQDYKNIYTSAGLDIKKTYKPLADRTEPFEWVNETKIAPWTIYVLTKG